MSLGQTISQLRTQRKLTQDDLANQLEVSRQSVSKWETDASTPELDKLMRMADLFGVTLDELVCGARPAEPGAAGPAETDRPSGAGENVPRAQLVLGGVLLGVGLLGLLILLLLAGANSLLFGAFFLSPFLICGAVCLKARRHVGLWCAWAVYVPQQIYWTYATGLTWQTILFTAQWTPQMNYMRLAIAWVMFLVRALLVVCAIRSFRSSRLGVDRRTAALLAAGCVVFLAACLISIPLPPMAWWTPLLTAFLSCLRLALGGGLLTVAAAVLRGRRDG